MVDCAPRPTGNAPSILLRFREQRVISAPLRHSGLSITKDIYVTFGADVMRSGYCG